MEDHLYECISELKRVDHLVFVSLKYTRTVDVIRSAVIRIIDCINNGIETLLLYKKEKKEIDDVPKVPTEKIETALRLFQEDETIANSIRLYALLRRIMRARYDKREEYRRHVTMISHMDDGTTEETDIDRLEEYYPLVKDFVLKTKKMITEDQSD
jgi:uncharacterized membrane protein